MGTKGDTNDALINIGKQAIFLWLMEMLELNRRSDCRRLWICPDYGS